MEIKLKQQMLPAVLFSIMHFLHPLNMKAAIPRARASLLRLFISLTYICDFLIYSYSVNTFLLFACIALYVYECCCPIFASSHTLVHMLESLINT